MTNLTRRTMMGGFTASGLVGLVGWPHYGSAQSGTDLAEIHVRDFGAVGDGRTNDTDALAAASRALKLRGGGTLVFEPKVYLIGQQRAALDPAKWAFAPSSVVEIIGCRNKVTIRGNGALLRCAPGLRYGTFDPQTGRATRNAMPFYEFRELASPYKAAIWLQENQSGIEITDLEIDGSIQDCVIGGRWGDKGWQINHCGIWLYNNRGNHLVRNVYTHHHGQDGLLLFTELRNESAPASPVVIQRVRSEYNGRQGVSITGGKNILLEDCKLSHTGQNGVVSSNPGAGLDIEAEMSLIRHVRVVRCEFNNNHGPAMIADTGDTKFATFEECRFIGTTAHAAWPNKPGIRFDRCDFAGAITRCYEEPNGGALATQFHDCTFHDSPTGSGARSVYGSRIDLGGSGGGTLFRRCRFRYTKGMQLPYTPATVRYVDCTMSQTSPDKAYPTGIYVGRNVIQGNVDLGIYSRIEGEVILNGKSLPRSA